MFMSLVLPLIAPTVIYLVWASITAKRRGQGLPGWEEGPWFWFILAGVVLAVASLVYFGLDDMAKGFRPSDPVGGSGSARPTG